MAGQSVYQRVDVHGGVVFLYERLDQLLVASGGGQVERREADLGARVDERLVRQQGVTHLQVALLGGQMQSRLTVTVEHVHSADRGRGGGHHITGGGARTSTGSEEEMVRQCHSTGGKPVACVLRLTHYHEC